MAEKDLVVEGKHEYSGIFSWKELYNFLYNHLTNNNYHVAEKLYGEKVNAGGKEIEVSWEAKRKINDYFRFFIKLLILIPHLSTVEATQNGKKIKTNKGTFNIKIQGFLEKDYESRWDTTPFMKFLRGMYDRYVIRARTEDYEDRLEEEVDEFVAQIKSFFALETRR